jgi:hypothetical protein
MIVFTAVARAEKFAAIFASLTVFAPLIEGAIVGSETVA